MTVFRDTKNVKEIAMRIGFYECDITPPLGGFLWGHYRSVYATEVKNRLYARAAVIEGEDGTCAAFVTVDTCALPPMIHETVTKRIFEYTGIPAENICISSNHTHWGAPVSDSPEIDCFADESYRDVFFRLTADAVTLAYNRLAPAEAKYGESLAEGIAFCRNYHLADGRVITHPPKDPAKIAHRRDADPTVRTVLAYRDGTPIGALVSFACHQCCCGDITEYTGDFSSAMSEKLKEIYGKDFVAVFLPGAAGDITHVVGPGFRTAPDHYRMMGETLARSVVDSAANAVSVEGKVCTVKETIRIPHRQLSDEELAEALKDLNERNQAMRARNLEYYGKACKKAYGDYYLQAIRMGDLCFYTMPGEVFSELGQYVLENSSYSHSIFVHNSNTYCGYIPTKESFGEGYDLYETSLCYHSCLTPDAGEIMTNRLLELGESLGAKTE